MLKITKEFITKEEELQILSHIKPSKVTLGNGRNRVHRYGSSLPYKAPMVSKSLPEWIDFVVQKLLTHGYLTERPDHITINEYHKGQAIDWHVDSPTSGDVITVLSLLSDATMGLRSPKGTEVRHPVPARSLTQMSEKERWEDQHCIYPVSDLRFSIVFRKGVKK